LFLSTGEKVSHTYYLGFVRMRKSKKKNYLEAEGLSNGPSCVVVFISFHMRTDGEC
jgi:hypothetical protein